jgi:hypothetical protein
MIIIRKAALSDDEGAAGALWARKHPGERCPGDPAAFKRGCGVQAGR